MENKTYSTQSFPVTTYTDVAGLPRVEVNVNDDSSDTCNSIFVEKQVEDIQRIDTEEREVSVFDVAIYVMGRVKECTTMKLHKLLYYCQAWTLVWDERPLFRENIEAWANGPVIRELFAYHKGMFSIKESDLVVGNETSLSPHQRDNINDVLDFYGDKSSQWLIDQTHMEAPWIEARKGLAQTERGNRVISHDSMYQYYSSLK